MTRLKTLCFALLIGAGPALLPAAPAALAQVSQIDASMASSAIMNAGSRAARVKSITRVPAVGVIRLDLRQFSTFSSTDVPDEQEFRILTNRNAAGVSALQRALAANPVTRAALKRHGVEVKKVAGVQISSNGSLRLYVYSRRNALR